MTTIRPPTSEALEEMLDDLAATDPDVTITVVLPESHRASESSVRAISTVLANTHGTQRPGGWHSVSWNNHTVQVKRSSTPMPFDPEEIRQGCIEALTQFL